jgi:hypothetical protein
VDVVADEVTRVACPGLEEPVVAYEVDDAVACVQAEEVVTGNAHPPRHIDRRGHAVERVRLGALDVRLQEIDALEANGAASAHREEDQYRPSRLVWLYGDGFAKNL